MRYLLDTTVAWAALTLAAFIGCGGSGDDIDPNACTTGSIPSTLRISESDCASTNMRAPNLAPSESMDSSRMPEPISCASSTMK